MSEDDDKDAEFGLEEEEAVFSCRGLFEGDEKDTSETQDLDWQDDDDPSDKPDSKQVPETSEQTFFRLQTACLRKLVRYKCRRQKDSLATYHALTDAYVNRNQFEHYKDLNWGLQLHELAVAGVKPRECVMLDRKTPGKTHFRFSSPGKTSDLHTEPFASARSQILLRFLRDAAAQKVPFVGWHFLIMCLFDAGLRRSTEEQTESKLVLELNRIILAMTLQDPTVSSLYAGDDVNPSIKSASVDIRAETKGTGYLRLIPLMTRHETPDLLVLRRDAGWAAREGSLSAISATKDMLIQCEQATFREMFKTGVVSPRIVQLYGLQWVDTRLEPSTQEKEWCSKLRDSTLPTSLYFSSVDHTLAKPASLGNARKKRKLDSVPEDAKTDNTKPKLKPTTAPKSKFSLASMNRPHRIYTDQSRAALGKPESACAKIVQSQPKKNKSATLT